MLLHCFTGGARTVLLLLVILFNPPPVAAAPGTEVQSLYQFSDPAQALALHGQAWGHGIGLCQWGARGRALAGQNGEQIVAAYYQSTTIQKAIAPETTIRVLVHSGLSLEPGQTTRITGQGGAWQLDAGGVPSVPVPADGFLELAGADGGMRYAVKAKDGVKLGEGAVRTAFVLRPQDAANRFVVAYKPAAEVAARPGTYYDTYRGELILSPGLNGELDTINRLGLDDYLRGVVPAEMPALWPAEALKAQTLAARSYVVWQAKSRAGQRYDVDDTTRFQVYLGANVERDNVNRLVDGTAGQLILFGGQVIQAYFFSTCAGWTENNEAIWGGTPLAYLRGIHDLDASGRAYDADSPVFSWTTGALTAGQLQDLLNADDSTPIGRLLSLDLTRRTPSGRLTEVRATGTRGTKALDPETFMARFNRLRPGGVAQLLSTNFDLRWTTAEAVRQTQGDTLPTATNTPAVRQATPVATTTPVARPGSGGQTAAASSPTPVPPTPIPTPAYHLEMTQPVPEKPSGPTNQYAPATGHNIGGAFLRLYQEQGGLDLFGYPRTEEILEDGLTVQYFQRARFEFHTEKVGTPYEVQLALLGDTLTTGRRPFPAAAPFESGPDHVYFPETGHGLHYSFLSFWRGRGELDVFGYPISEELPERGFTVQYFQRARFEYHPELPEPYQVSLGLLGDQLLTQRFWLK